MPDIILKQVHDAKIQPESDFDITIVGAGMIGLSLAIALANEGFNIAIIDKSFLTQDIYSTAEQPDIRVSSLSLGTKDFLAKIHVWEHLEKQRYTPYSKLSTWDAHLPAVNFDSANLGYQQLGFMVENSILQSTLISLVKQKINITFFEGASVTKISSIDENEVQTIEFDCANSQKKSIYSKLIVGADGAQSSIRRLANIGTIGWQYNQSCMLITVKTNSLEKDITWQQFTPSGPKAYLPLHDNWASLIWYDDKVKIKQLMSLSDEQLTNEIKLAFPARIGEIEVIDKAMFPLTRMHAKTYWKPRIALVGDAAHTINPLAGQGANLGFKDIEYLSNLIVTSHNSGKNWYSNEVLSKYNSKRIKDNLLMQSAMDAIYFSFSNKNRPIKLLRNFLFMAVEHNNLIKNFILKYAIGLKQER
ncbi:FAD-dependent monooxygenase [Thorsellia anophelis]|uniref:2-octaprenyl-3-methyl-6-methoxy-1,4-benzoquinol hydroxylase n=1 Tax=Thorsellia anophelis DSM 18579 TaxID=1123402 RepID=A0A1I0BQ40_9GAMM|nr:FAD-dependent monooxygenase [Thorsellia anophelis]SET09193.1 2-octaprenyl-3-methyl-6-methoxy-1,4-benzoquinol hydroxylase [Thorsellia anophelis DSM 18579]